MSSNKRMIDWLEAKRKADELADADGDSDRVTEAYEDVDDKMELLTQSLENTDSGFLGDDDDILHAAKLGRYIKLAQQQLPLDGAELELNTELGIESRGTEGGVLIPMILLGPRNRREHERLQAKMQEKLADVATTITSGDFQTTLRDSIKPVFAASDTAFLGIPIYGVSPGQDRIPIISSVPDPAMLGKGDDQEAVAATITSVKFNPRRLQSTILYNSVDAKFNWTPNMEAELTQALVGKITESMDTQVLNGDGTGDNPLGIYASFKGNKLPTDPTSEASLASYAAAISAEVEGKYAARENTFRLLVGTKTFGHMRSKMATSGIDDVVDKLERMGVGIQASTRPAAVVSKKQDAILSLSPLAAMNAYYVGVWNQAEIIMDPYTKSRSGQIYMTVVTYFDAAPILGPSNRSTNSDLGGAIKRLRFQVAA